MCQITRFICSCGNTKIARVSGCGQGCQLVPEGQDLGVHGKTTTVLRICPPCQKQPTRSIHHHGDAYDAGMQDASSHNVQRHRNRHERNTGDAPQSTVHQKSHESNSFAKAEYRRSMDTTATNDKSNIFLKSSGSSESSTTLGTPESSSDDHNQTARRQDNQNKSKQSHSSKPITPHQSQHTAPISRASHDKSSSYPGKKQYPVSSGKSREQQARPVTPDSAKVVSSGQYRKAEDFSNDTPRPSRRIDPCTWNMATFSCGHKFLESISHADQCAARHNKACSNNNQGPTVDSIHHNRPCDTCPEHQCTLLQNVYLCGCMKEEHKCDKNGMCYCDVVDAAILRHSKSRRCGHCNRHDSERCTLIRYVHDCGHEIQQHRVHDSGYCYCHHGKNATFLISQLDDICKACRQMNQCRCRKFKFQCGHSEIVHNFSRELYCCCESGADLVLKESKKGVCDNCIIDLKA